MPFNKLHPALLDALEVRSIETPTPLQKRSIPIIKSGANVFCIGPKDCGKTTTLILTTLQKLKCEAIENAPRAIVIVKNKLITLFQVFRKACAEGIPCNLAPIGSKPFIVENHLFVGTVFQHAK